MKSRKVFKNFLDLKLPAKEIIQINLKQNSDLIKIKGKKGWNHTGLLAYNGPIV